MTTLSVPKVRVGKIKGVAVEIDIPDALTVLDDPKEAAPQGCGCFRIMTKEDGDKRVVWNSMNLGEIRAAKEMFDQLIQEGLVPYKVGVDGQASSEVMDEFDPVAEEVIFMPVAMVAGG